MHRTTQGTPVMCTRKEMKEEKEERKKERKKGQEGGGGERV